MNTVNQHHKITLVECPRDAMQGWASFIPTEQKVAYLNALLKVGFDVLDFGSFVSPKAIPQMADTKMVLPQLDITNTGTKLLAIIANERGALDAVGFESIHYLGFPFSVSETFQQRNTNSSIRESLDRVKAIQEICVKHGRELVVYLSMGFGNPYGDPWSPEIVFQWADTIASLGIKTISLADTVGLASPEDVLLITKFLIMHLPQCTIGVHLHSSPNNREAKLRAALDAGCRRVDAAMKGIGGCPMAGDELVGNMDTEWTINFLADQGFDVTLDKDALINASQIAAEIFNH